MESEGKQFRGFREPQKASDVFDSLHAETVARECLPTTEEQLKKKRNKKRAEKKGKQPRKEVV